MKLYFIPLVGALIVPPPTQHRISTELGARTRSRRARQAKSQVIKESYSVEDAVKVLKDAATAKFVESAEAHFCLNLQTKFSDQQLRTTFALPKGTGKEIRVAVLSSENHPGADICGNDDLIAAISKGELDFDMLLTSPDMMPKLTKLGKVLGPKGLMPSTKAGTIATDLPAAIKEFKGGKVECRADKTGVVHLLFGKTDFSDADLAENFYACYDTVKTNRPSGVKGKYIKSINLCSTMGPSINIDLAGLPV